jgi:hypothetical protein
VGDCRFLSAGGAARGFYTRQRWKRRGFDGIYWTDCLKLFVDWNFGCHVAYFIMVAIDLSMGPRRSSQRET